MGRGNQNHDWLSDKKSHADVIEKFQKEKFQIGAHKAYLVSRDALRYNLKTFTSLDYNTVSGLLLNPVTDLQSEIDKEVSKLDIGERVAVIPHAASIIPCFSG